MDSRSEYFLGVNHRGTENTEARRTQRHGEHRGTENTEAWRTRRHGELGGTENAEKNETRKRLLVRQDASRLLDTRVNLFSLFRDPFSAFIPAISSVYPHPLSEMLTE